MQLTTDQRKFYVKTLFWQFLVLILSIWLPSLILFSHVHYFLEIRGLPYHIGIFKAIWLNFSISGIKNPLSKLWAVSSWLFLCFIMVLITADLSSIIASANDYKNLSPYDSSVCSTVFNFYQKPKSSKTCLDSVDNDESDAALIGKLELGALENEDLNKYYVLDSTGAEVLFHLVLHQDNSTEIYDEVIKRYWEKNFIRQAYMEYVDSSYQGTSKYSLIFTEIVVLLLGISIFALFLAVVVVLSLFKKAEPEVANAEEPSPSSRSLLAKNPSHTLSLESSVVNRLGSSRPEEWVNKAVDINDENAHKINNVQDYENEISSVKPVNPSFASEKSILSMISPLKK